MQKPNNIKKRLRLGLWLLVAAGFVTLCLHKFSQAYECDNLQGIDKVQCEVHKLGELPYDIANFVATPVGLLVVVTAFGLRQSLKEKKETNQ
jgi:hypothetical protein